MDCKQIIFLFLAIGSVVIAVGNDDVAPQMKSSGQSQMKAVASDNKEILQSTAEESGQSISVVELGNNKETEAAGSIGGHLTGTHEQGPLISNSTDEEDPDGRLFGFLKSSRAGTKMG